MSAAKASAKTATKTAGKAAAKAAVRNSTRTIAREMVPGVRAQLDKKLLREYSEEIADEVCWSAAESLAWAAAADDPDVKDVLLSLDPTGIADVTEAYAMPTCSFGVDPPIFPK